MKCQAFPCHCKDDKLGWPPDEAKYIVTYDNGKERPVSRHCADMHIMAGIRCRKLTMGDIMAAKFDE